MNSTKYEELELRSLKCTELRELCKENGVKPKGRGRKFELIETLQSIPLFEEDDNDSTLEGSVHIIDTPHTDRPVFGDISFITTNSIASNRKKRRIGNETMRSVGISNEENTLFYSPIGGEMSETVKDQDLLQKLSSDVKEKEEDLETLIQRFDEPVKLLVSVIENKKTELERNRCKGENYLQELLEQKLSEKEMHLKSKYEDEINTVRTDKDLMEKVLKEDFGMKLRQKEILMNTKEIEMKRMKIEIETQLREREELIRENKRLSDNMKVSDEEQKKLKISVDNLKKDIERKEKELTKQIELTQVIEANVKHNVTETIEDEFTCIICQELFINAVTLPCAHSFCEMCLRTWFKTKKTCPVCRHDVKLKALYSVVLDSVIECIVENMDTDSKRKRTNLLRERNELKRRNDAMEDPLGISKMIYRVGADNTNNIGAPVPVASNLPVANNRRRSRSQSPARVIQNRQLANNNNNIRNINNQAANHFHQALNNYQRNNVTYNSNHQNRMYGGGIRCYHCGANHHIRDCPSRNY